VLEVFYGLFLATDVAYFTYIYSKVDKSHYQEVTGHTWAAFLFGKAFSAFISQILISSELFSYYSLNFFTLGGLLFSCIFINGASHKNGCFTAEK
jgi:thiamine transporter 2/3